MLNYDIFTDSSCDLSKEFVEKHDVKVMQLEVIMDDKPPVLNKEIEVKSFYNSLREGSNAKTSAVTPGYFEEHMRKSLESGKDILYLGFSSGLSVTYSNGVMVLKELMEEFPERKISYLDTLSGSGGQALLVYHAALMKEAGASMEEVYKEIDSLREYVHHQVTVEDLMFLKRGGRIDAKSAIIGTMLKIKPIINVMQDGKLASVDKVRGRKASMNELVKRMKENIDTEKNFLSLFTAVKSLQDGTMEMGNNYTLGLDSGAVGLAKNANYEAIVSEAIRTAVEEVEAKIIGGEIAVSSAFSMTTEEVVALRDSMG